MSTAGPTGEVKARAWQRWQQLGWPTTHNEAWRNFSTKPLQELDLGGGIVAGAPVPDALVASLPTPRVVFVDGRLAPGLCVNDGVAVAVRRLGGEDVPDDRIDRVAPADGALEALNTALLGDGVAIDVPAGFASSTLHVVHLVTGQGTAHVRTVVRLAEGASLTLGQLHIGLGEGAYFINAVTEVELAPGASLELGKCVREGPAGMHLDAVHARIGARASFKSFTLSLSGARSRTAITATLAGAHASADVDGLYFGKGRSKLDHVTDIRHAVGDTRSSETWAGVLDERAEGGFQGVIRIDRDAARSATRQLTRTLLLSNDAEAHAKPELHIDCDDVQASHGATIGQLDAMEQFYLASRGIPPEDARRMLIRAFVNKALSLAPEALRATFEAAVTAELGGVAVVEDSHED